jgi:ferredoxin
MGKIIFNDREEFVENGTSITPACEKLGLVFGCYSGMCGICEIEILEGEKNLIYEGEGITAHKPKVLACMCELKHGNVKIKF